MYQTLQNDINGYGLATSLILGQKAKDSAIDLGALAMERDELQNELRGVSEPT
ncbi:MAG: hypothetical protein PHP02_09080 [Eubacteriales bacterium]|nr:hypothetical protein [Eubacteriales bacterium]